MDKVKGICLYILSKIKENKKIAIGVLAVLLVIILIVIIANASNGKPSKYEDKIKTVVKALNSESKMKSAIKDVIDVKGAAAWQEADQESEDFNKEYKKLKKDDDEVEDMEKALKEYAKNASEEYKVKSIKEPKRDSKNKKIWTVTATLEEDGDEAQVKFVFYKGKVIDVIHKSSGSSLFEVMLKSYNSKDKE